MKIETKSWNVLERGQRAGVAALSLFLASDLILKEFGIWDFCAKCTGGSRSTWLVAAGLVCWSAVFVLLRKNQRKFAAPAIGALTGAHLALMGSLVAKDWYCVTCVAAGSLAIVLFGASVVDGRKSRVLWASLAAGFFSAQVFLFHEI